MENIRGKVAVAGIAIDHIGEAPAGFTNTELTADVARRALGDAGLKMTDVDGLCSVSFDNLMHTPALAEYLGLAPRFLDGTMVGGSSFVQHCISASLAIAHGLCDVALICYAATPRSERVTPGPGPRARHDPYQAPYKPRNPMNAYALAAARHMHEFGTTRAQLAAVAVAARQWAQKNPVAYMRDPLTIEEVLAARPVVDPFTVRDACLITDGAAAVVLVSAERARDLPQPPVYLLGGALANSHADIAQMPDLTVSAAARSGPAAFAMAGLSPDDIDVLEFYDAFTINPILFLEDLGYCAKGEGGPFVASGAIAPGGSLPVNTNGGGLSCVHPGMYGLFLIVEAVEQLRGAAGARQIPGANTVLCQGNGGVLSTQVTTIWGTEAALG